MKASQGIYGNGEQALSSECSPTPMPRCSIEWMAATCQDWWYEVQYDQAQNWSEERPLPAILRCILQKCDLLFQIFYAPIAVRKLPNELLFSVADQMISHNFLWLGLLVLIAAIACFGCFFSYHFSKVCGTASPGVPPGLVSLNVFKAMVFMHGEKMDTGHREIM